MVMCVVVLLVNHIDDMKPFRSLYIFKHVLAMIRNTILAVLCGECSLDWESAQSITDLRIEYRIECNNKNNGEHGSTVPFITSVVPNPQNHI